MRLGDIVDQLHDDHGLADARSSEQADLSALRIRRQKIDDLDSGDENLGLGRLLDEFRRRLVNGPPSLGVERPRLVHRLPDDIHDAPERFVSDRHGDRAARIHHTLPAHQAFG